MKTPDIGMAVFRVMPDNTLIVDWVRQARVRRACKFPVKHRGLTGCCDEIAVLLWSNGDVHQPEDDKWKYKINEVPV